MMFQHWRKQWELTSSSVLMTFYSFVYIHWNMDDMRSRLEVGSLRVTGWGRLYRTAVIDHKETEKLKNKCVLTENRLKGKAATVQVWVWVRRLSVLSLSFQSLHPGTGWQFHRKTSECRIFPPGECWASRSFLFQRKKIWSKSVLNFCKIVETDNSGKKQSSYRSWDILS